MALKLFPDSVITIFLGFMTALSLLMPVVLFFVGRHGAAVQARGFPERRILVGANGISVGMGEVTEAAREIIMRGAARPRGSDPR